MATESAVTPAGLPPLHGRARTVHGAQRLVRQPRHHPARTAFRRNRLRQRERHRGRRAVHRQAAGRRPRRGVGVEGAVRDVRRLLHAAGLQPRLVRGGPRRDRLQARRDRRDRRLGGRWAANTGLWQDFPVSRTRAIWEPEPEVVYAWTKPRDHGFDLRTTPLRDVNAALHAPDLSGEFVISHPAGAHNVAVGAERAGEGRPSTATSATTPRA